ncbi:MAG: hypothetical protein JNL82_01260 [Myxococcales bacterium]|nr:hypothetical protein [Myxococcales bacterium]
MLSSVLVTGLLCTQAPPSSERAPAAPQPSPTSPAPPATPDTAPASRPPITTGSPATGAAPSTPSAGADTSAQPSGGFFGDATTQPNKTPAPARASGGFFGDATTQPNKTPPPASVEGPAAPPMPPIEDLPPKPPLDPAGPKITLGGAKGRKPISGGGAGFFDPGKLTDSDAGSSGGLMVRGYLGVNFGVQQRTNTAMHNADGNFDKLKTLPYFGGGAANLYVGAPVYSDVVYARIAFEFVSIPRATYGFADVTPAFNPVVIMEAAALDVNPFAWAEKSGRWFREGFKITGGVFVIPFGLEDEEHDAPVRWWVSRPLAMSAGRIYPGTWIDLGATIKWKPTFGRDKPVRPLEIDVGLINGDACTQTRNNDFLYRYVPVGQVSVPCERTLRPVELPRGDGSVLGIAPDNNGNKSFVARVMIRPLPALNIGGSIVWGKHPQSTLSNLNFFGKTYIDSAQAPTWRVGGHLDLNFDEIFASPYPLPHLRGEVIYGVDSAAPQDPDMPVLADRRMFGAYAQVAQPLWRRKKTRLPGLIIQYRFDHADPDLAVPGKTADGQPLKSDFSDQYRYDETLQAHVVGLRFPVLPRFTLKAEYSFLREDGGRQNRLYNDNFSFQAVADF